MPTILTALAVSFAIFAIGTDILQAAELSPVQHEASQIVAWCSDTKGH